MGFLQKSASAIGSLVIVGVLGLTFLVGVIGVGILQLKGDEIEIPKVVGKNFNKGGDELASFGLRIKKISSRYSEEEPNTILEQRPRAGTVAKTGLMISVVVSQENPDGNEAPANVKTDEEVIEEIEELPELKTDKPKKRKSRPKKTAKKTRDVIEEKTKDADPKLAESKDATTNPKPGANSQDKPKVENKVNTTKPPVTKPIIKPKGNKPKPPPTKKGKPKTSGDARPRKVTKSN